MATGARNKVVYQALGLYSLANQFNAPEGAMDVATDVVVDRPGIVESRYKYQPLAYNSGTLKAGATGLGAITQPGSGITQSYRNQVNGTFAGGLPTQIQSFYGLWDSGLEVLQVDNAGGSGSHGEVFSSFRANGNNYFMSGGKMGDAYSFGTNNFVSRLDALASNNLPNTVRTTGCGMPEALTPVDYTGTAGSGLTGLPTAASTVLSSGGQRAYRIMFATKDLQLNLVRGPPSGRHIVFSATSYTYGLIIPLPKGQLYAGDIVQIYSSEVASATVGEPSDNMLQVGEYILQAADITNGYTTFQDKFAITGGAALYTNDTQEGINAAEARPPNCALGVYHKNVAWYGAVGGKQQAAVLTLLGINGWTAGTTAFALNGVTYTAATTENLGAHQFQINWTGFSVAQANAATARSIARCISWNNAALYAFYATSANSIAIQIVIKTMQVGDLTTYTLTSANIPSGTTIPTLPLTLKDDAKTSRLYYSKPNQPEAVPDLSFLAIGSPDYDITGLASLRDSLFVFKQDGLYRVTGTTATDIRVELFDATVKMYPGQFPSIARAGNQVFALCNQGVISVTESGVNLLSRNVDDLLIDYASQASSLSSGTGRKPFIGLGCATESGRKYVLVCTDNANITGNGAGYQQIFVYNFLQNSWVSWTPPSACIGICSELSGTKETIILNSGNSATYQNYPVAFVGTLTASFYNGSSFSYCVEDIDNPGVLSRFYDVRLILNESVGLTTLTCQFNSDSGAAPVSVTQTVGAGQYSVIFQVPRDHSECCQLNYTVTSSTSQRMVVQSCVTTYDILSDRMSSSRG